ncbi:MAG: hypothetical protein WCT42_01930 [Candidatus Paceibacterota bacterium]
MKTLLILSLSTGMVWGLTIGIIISILVLFLLLIYYVLAPNNIFFTFGRENRVMYTMRGKEFSGKVILPSKTLYVNTEDNYAIKKIADLTNPKESDKYKPFGILGMHWVGIYPFYKIYERRQQWLEWKSLEGGKRKIILRDEMSPFLIAKPFEYAMMTDEAEDEHGMPLNVFFTVTLVPTNALSPMFGNDNAYGQVQTKCISQVLLFTKKKTFSTLGGDNKTSNVTNDEFSVLLRSLNETIPGNNIGDGIKKILGYEIIDAMLNNVVIGGENAKELLDASTLEYIAIEKKKAKIADAEGDLQATLLNVQGQEAKFKIQTDFYKNLSNVPGAMDVEKRKATPGLTTLVEGDGDKKTSLIIGGNK